MKKSWIKDAYAQLTWQESLRDIQATLGSNASNIYGVGDLSIRNHPGKRAFMRVIEVFQSRPLYQRRLKNKVLPTFAGRVLPFDLDIFGAYAGLMARAGETGKAIGKADGYIPAKASVRSLMVVTLAICPFEAENP